jgi:hypothetical protein
MGAAALGISAGALSGETAANVVSVHYSVREIDPAKLERTVLTTVERSMKNLDRVVQIKGTASHYMVDVEVSFKGNATAEDLAAVTTQADMLQFDDDVIILSRVIDLRPPHLQGSWEGR